jgi:hypothetical protein
MRTSLAIGLTVLASVASGCGPGKPAATGDDAAPGDDAACATTVAAANVVHRPVDIIVSVDTSPSMGEAVAAVRTNINVNFATILESSGIDYRVILLADYPSLCIDPPLGGADCTTPPANPANTSRFFQYSISMGSTEGLSRQLDTYNTADPNGAAAGGWSDWTREDSAKVFLQFSDTTGMSDISAAEFDDALLALTPMRFGTAEQREYVYHGIQGVPANTPPSKPYLPTDPVLTGGCSNGSLSGTAQAAYQDLAILTGGLRFPICESGLYDVVFNEVANAAVQAAKVACSYEKPVAPPGQYIDENTVAVRYTPSAGGTDVLFGQVLTSAACRPNAFYIEGDQVVLCPEACTLVQSDASAVVTLEYGCMSQLL